MGRKKGKENIKKGKGHKYQNNKKEAWELGSRYWKKEVYNENSILES